MLQFQQQQQVKLPADAKGSNVELLPCLRANFNTMDVRFSPGLPFIGSLQTFFTCQQQGWTKITECLNCINLMLTDSYTNPPSWWCNWFSPDLPPLCRPCWLPSRWVPSRPMEWCQVGEQTPTPHSPLCLSLSVSLFTDCFFWHIAAGAAWYLGETFKAPVWDLVHCVHLVLAPKITNIGRAPAIGRQFVHVMRGGYVL